jgi:chromosome segregation ATPase
MKKTLLKKLKVSRVDLVATGANQEDDDGSHVLLFKRAPDGDHPKPGEEIMKEVKDMTPEELLAHVTAVEKAKEETEGKLTTATADLEKATKDLKTQTEKVTTLTKSVTDLEAEVKKLTPVKKDDDKDDILKGLPEEVKKQVDAQIASEREAREKVEKALQVERDARLDKEYLEKAAPLKAVPGKPEEIAKMLKAIDENLPEEQATAINKALSTMSEAIVNGELLKSMGEHIEQPEDLTPMEELEKVAKTLMAADKDLTAEQAMAQASADNPKLVEAYRAAN